MPVQLQKRFKPIFLYYKHLHTFPFYLKRIWSYRSIWRVFLFLWNYSHYFLGALDNSPPNFSVLTHLFQDQQRNLLALIFASFVTTSFPLSFSCESVISTRSSSDKKFSLPDTSSIWKFIVCYLRRYYMKCCCFFSLYKHSYHFVWCLWHIYIN